MGGVLSEMVGDKSWLAPNTGGSLAVETPANPLRDVAHFGDISCCGPG